MNKRAVILSTALLFGFFLVIVRLADIMLLRHEKLLKKAREQHILRKDMDVARGVIYDRKGRELAVNIETDSLYCNPKKIDSIEGFSRRLSQLTSLRYDDLVKLSHSNKNFVWLKRKLDPELSEKVKELNLNGIGFITEFKRFYPKGSLASHLIGTVGIDNQALEGVEIRYDDLLKKAGGEIAVLRDADGLHLSEGTDTEVKGNNIVLTIDEGLQFIVEEELENALSKWNASHGSVIMMDPYTGEVLAMASRPTYDPNMPSKSSLLERRNRAITDLYEPGSTFKLITAAASLDEGVVELDSIFDCSQGSIKLGKWLISDAHRHGRLTFKEVIQKSSNVGSVMAGLKVGRERLVKYAKRFGFSEKTGIDLLGEAEGWISADTEEGDVATATLSIGYGVAVTPIQVLRAYSAIANGGVLVTPHVVSEIRTPDGYLISSFKPKNEMRAISSKTADILKDVLVSVTEKAGTAYGARIDGNLTAGKTGTAKILDVEKKRYSIDKYVSSFVGFIPADNPRVALIVVIYEPKGSYYGGLVSAPVFKNIGEKTLAYLNIPRDDLKEENTFIVRVKGIKE